jgi:hypothetical protein
MNIFYTSDGEQPCTMQLDTLIANFDESDLCGWKYRHNETDMRNELASRGWYEGEHDFGRYLVLNIDKFGLATA